MRILVVGAGAIGGYFGGRLLQARRDVTFLVRARRAAQLRESGLSIRSSCGDFHLERPPTIQADALHSAFDLILLSCKAYDLDAAIDSFAPAVGSDTRVLPLLNGMRHLDRLEARFGAEAILGGQCAISSTLDSRGSIEHLNDLHHLAFGERKGGRSARAEAILAALSDAGFEAKLSESILQEMWEKWVFIAAAAGITCLMRASIGDIVAAGAAGQASALYDECAQIARLAGFEPRAAAWERSRMILTTAGSSLTASMLRDVELGARTEGEQILGDLLRRQAPGEADASLLRIAYAHLQAYEARRARELAARAPGPEH